MTDYPWGEGREPTAEDLVGYVRTHPTAEALALAEHMLDAARRGWRCVEHHGRTCRVCACTDSNACVVAGGGNEVVGILVTCHWVEPDLCSACVVGQSVSAPQTAEDAPSRT